MRYLLVFLFAYAGTNVFLAGADTDSQNDALRAVALPSMFMGRSLILKQRCKR